MTALIQQTNETISANIQNWNALHNVSSEQGEMNRAIYDAEKIKRYKIRLIEAFRKAQKN